MCIAVSRAIGQAEPRERITPVAFDLADTAAMPEFVRDLRQRFGPIYGLVNNAGLGTEGLLANMPDADIEALIRAQHAVADRAQQICRARHDGAGARARRQYLLDRRVDRLQRSFGLRGDQGLARRLHPIARARGRPRRRHRQRDRARVHRHRNDRAGSASKDRERIVARSALRRLAEPSDVAAMAAYLMGEGGRNISGAVLTVDAGGTA